MKARLACLLVMVLVCAACLALPSNALAENDSTNGNWYSADGPAQSGVTVHGTLANNDDVDWYYFYVGTTSNVTIGYNAADSSSRFTWYQFDGGTLNSQDDKRYWSSWSTSRQLTPGLYLVEFSGGTGAYDFTVTGTGVTTVHPAGVPLANQKSAHSEDFTGSWADAQGPAASGVTQVSTLANNDDVDWYYFYVGTTSNVTIGYNASDSSSRFTWYQFDGGTLNSQDDKRYWSSWSTSRQLTPGLYLVEFSGGTGAYDFTVTGTGVTTVHPAGVPLAGAKLARAEDLKSAWTDAQGPAASGVTQISNLSNNDDVDWYYFNVGAVSDVTLGFNVWGDSASFAWYKFDGGALVEENSVSYWDHWSTEKRLEPGRYYVKVWNGSGAYDFTATGSGVITTDPPAYHRTKLSATSASSVKAKATIALSGKLTPAPGGARVSIVISRLAGGLWRTMGSASVAVSKGRFSYRFKPRAKGSWRAVFKYSGLTSAAVVYGDSSASRGFRVK